MSIRSVRETQFLSAALAPLQLRVTVQLRSPTRHFVFRKHKFGLLLPCRGPVAVQAEPAVVAAAAAPAAADSARETLDFKLRIKLRSYFADKLSESVDKIREAVASTSAHLSGPVYLPTRFPPSLPRLTVLH